MLSQQRPRGGARLCVPVGPQWAAVPAPLSPRGQAGRLECRCAGMNLNEGRYCQSVMAELECVLAVYCMVDCVLSRGLVPGWVCLAPWQEQEGPL